MHDQQTAFKNIVGKGEIARNEQFLLFPQCFLLNQIIVSPFVNSFDIISLFAAELEEPKLSQWGKGLNKWIFLVHKRGSTEQYSSTQANLSRILTLYQTAKF